MMTANQKEPYFYRMPLDPTYARTGPQYTEKLETHTKIPVIQSSQANKPEDISPMEITFTEKPVNTEPVSRNGYIEHRKYGKSIPAYILKSVELNNRDLNENEVNIKDILSNVRPNQIHRIQIPIISKEPVSRPMQNILSFALPGLSKTRLPLFNKKPVNPTKEYNYPLAYRPPLNGFSLPIENINSENKPANELMMMASTGEYDNYRLSTLNKKRVKPLLSSAQKPFSKNFQKDNLLKEKLVSLLLSTKKDFEKQVIDLQSIHDTLKTDRVYKIGYLTGHMNKMNKYISMLYRSVQHNWDALQILEAYEEVKKNNDNVRELLNEMRSCLRAKKKPEQIGSRVDKPPFVNSISWAYYDDTMP